MTEDQQESHPEPVEKPSEATDWEALRAEAAKLGISLSELQQKQRQQKLRRDKKAG